MPYKSTGTAGKSASGASMSKYDVEVEARLKALESNLISNKQHTEQTQKKDCEKSKSKNNPF